MAVLIHLSTEWYLLGDESQKPFLRDAALKNTSAILQFIKIIPEAVKEKNTLARKVAFPQDYY